MKKWNINLSEIKNERKMNPIRVTDYLEQHQIEEKIPYFGKARLYTIFLPKDQNSLEYIIPREIFHFITAIYINIINENWINQLQMQLKISSDFEISIEKDHWSHFQQEKRVNLLMDPLLYGQFMNPRFQIHRTTETDRDTIIFHMLVEYAKILPEEYQQLQEKNEISLLSQQSNQIELIQMKGTCIVWNSS